MAARTVTCKNCGTTFTTRFKVQVYCSHCQILRDLNFGMKNRDCVACGTNFWPIRNTYRVCSKCIEATPRAATQQVQCGHCGAPGRAVPGTDKICLGCVEANEKIRNQYREVLRLHVRKTREANGVT